ncbi:MAG: DnaB-like helicase N-terminal domain-containing protein, partial [Opitutales bacterium]|nr:DnaB-like helicase N-terminal domain-containing protein [Opitutales bacterium]
MPKEPGRTGKAGGRSFMAEAQRALPEDPALQDPHNIDAEQGLIASCLIDGTGDVLSECFSRGIQGDVFYHPQHKVLFDAIQRLFEDGKPIDMIVLTDYLRSNQLLDAVGGIVYLSQITNRIESTVHARYWIDIVRDKHVLRQLKRTAET